MDATDIQKRLRAHGIAFVAILVLTLVAAGSVMAGVSNLYLIIAIATVQTGIILGSMMHARAEGPWIRGVLFFAALFVAVLLGVLALGQRSTIAGTEQLHSEPTFDAAAPEAH